MKRLLSITLLLSAVTVQAADGSKQRSILSNAVSSLANAFSGESSTDSNGSSENNTPNKEAQLASASGRQSPIVASYTQSQLDALLAKIKVEARQELEQANSDRVVPAAAVASTRNFQQEVATIAIAGAQGAADELLGAGGSEQLATLIAKLEAAGKEPSVANLLVAANMTTAMAAQLAPHFNAEGLAKVKAGCCKGAQKGLAEQAGAPTRGGRKVAFVKIKLPVEEAQAVHQLLGAISTVKTAAVELTADEAGLVTRTLTTRTRGAK